MLFEFSVVVLFSVVQSHTWLHTPAPRGGAFSRSNNRQSECGESSTIQSTWTRGQEVPFQWARNNHNGGFVQLSVIGLTSAKVGDSERLDELDNPSNIIHMECYNTNCEAVSGPDKIGCGGDPGGDNSNKCGSFFKVPSYLADGNYVLKYATYGQGDSFGVNYMPHVSYSSCHNFRVAGGNTLTGKPANNAHISWGRNNGGMVDKGIGQILAQTGQNVPQNQCVFMASTTHYGCVPSGQKSPRCTGEIASLTRCGTDPAESRTTCLRYNSESQTDGGALYNYMVGVPAFHPNFNGIYQMLSHTSATLLKKVTLPSCLANGCGSTVAAPTPSTNPACPERCFSCQGGGTTDGGVPISGGVCPAWCSEFGYCGSSSIYMNLGTDCTKCVVTTKLGEGEKCATTSQCATGLKCYVKNAFWSSCHASCIPGIHLQDAPEYQTPWACTTDGATAPPTPQPLECIDYSSQCASYVSGNIACNDTIYQNYMTVYCTKTCLQCQNPAACVDRNSNCAAWTSSGFCNRAEYTKFMGTNCAKSCKRCIGVGAFEVGCSGLIFSSCTQCPIETCMNVASTTCVPDAANKTCIDKSEEIVFPSGAESFTVPPVSAASKPLIWVAVVVSLVIAAL